MYSLWISAHHSHFVRLYCVILHVLLIKIMLSLMKYFIWSIISLNNHKSSMCLRPRGLCGCDYKRSRVSVFVLRLVRDFPVNNRRLGKNKTTIMRWNNYVTWRLLVPGRELTVLGKCYILPLIKGWPSIGRFPQLEKKGEREVKLNGGKQELSHLVIAK